jgi:cell division inhibitor SepF
MGLGQALRALVDPYEGAEDEYDYDDAAAYAPSAQTEGSGGTQPHERLRRGDDGRLSAAEPRVRRPRPTVALITPADFDDAQQIADRLKADTPVIIDLGDCGADLSQRLLDFSSGLAYALDASLEYVGESVVLLAPQDVVLAGGTADPSPRFFNQV